MFSLFVCVVSVCCCCRCCRFFTSGQSPITAGPGPANSGTTKRGPPAPQANGTRKDPEFIHLKSWESKGTQSYPPPNKALLNPYFWGGGGGIGGGTLGSHDEVGLFTKNAIEELRVKECNLFHSLFPTSS